MPKKHIDPVTNHLPKVWWFTLRHWRWLPSKMMHDILNFFTTSYLVIYFPFVLISSTKVDMNHVKLLRLTNCAFGNSFITGPLLLWFIINMALSHMFLKCLMLFSLVFVNKVWRPHPLYRNTVSFIRAFFRINCH